jgi:hypothetical protein
MIWQCLRLSVYLFRSEIAFERIERKQEESNHHFINFSLSATLESLQECGFQARNRTYSIDGTVSAVSTRVSHKRCSSEEELKVFDVEVLRMSVFGPESKAPILK